jgi:hypothetical protein
MANPLVGRVTSFARDLRFPQLFLLAAAVFVLDLLIPDGIPFADELVLALVTVMLGRWKRK